MCKIKSRRVWDYWLAGVVGSFAALQYPAIRYKCHDPLSDTLWRYKLGPAIFAVATWLLVHLVRYSPRAKEHLS